MLQGPQATAGLQCPRDRPVAQATKKGRGSGAEGWEEASLGKGAVVWALNRHLSEAFPHHCVLGIGAEYSSGRRKDPGPFRPATQPGDGHSQPERLPTPLLAQGI